PRVSPSLHSLFSFSRTRPPPISTLFPYTTLFRSHIRVPENLEGNAYVNVTFVRSPDSPDIFTQPLSYAVAPFAIDRSARTIGLDLHVPDKVKPGDTLPIRFKTAQPRHIIVYALDEGILQVANYRL